MVRYYLDPLAPRRIPSIGDSFISGPSYTEMVRKSVIVCTDIVLTLVGDKALYLAKRAVYPMKGIWVLGGRVWFNDESLEESVVRCVYDKTGQEFGASRFKLLKEPHMYSWIKTRQGDFPGKNLAFTFQLEATGEEIEKIAENLSASEYDRSFGIQCFSRERLVTENVHPMLLDLFDEIFPV